jgi:hypothetical protein
VHVCVCVCVCMCVGGGGKGLFTQFMISEVQSLQHSMILGLQMEGVASRYGG